MSGISTGMSGIIGMAGRVSPSSLFPTWSLMLKDVRQKCLHTVPKKGSPDTQVFIKLLLVSHLLMSKASHKVKPRVNMGAGCGLYKGVYLGRWNSLGN